MRVALIHDWLTGMRGGEKVLEVFCELFPQAEIFTLLSRPESLSELLQEMKIHNSFLQSFPGVFKNYRNYLPLFPRAIEGFDLKGFDLVISTSHAVAKGVRVPPQVNHLCYCFTPMRYIWFLTQDYFGKNPLKLAALYPFLAYLRHWDRATAKRVSRFIAISETVARRIERIYNRPSDIIYPPVDVKYFTPGPKKDDYFLIVSALVPYKKVNLAVETFNRMGLKLKIVGSGPGEDGLRGLAGPNVEVLGWRSDQEIRELYRGCRALIFPGLEDFGIVPLEAMACGRPVIGLGEGGLTETVISRDSPEQGCPTGIFFREQSREALQAAVEEFIRVEDKFDPLVCRNRAEEFSRTIFKKQIQKMLKPYLE